MKRIFALGILFVGLTFLVISCGKDITEPQDYRLEYLGSWNANDKEGWNAPAFYTISISAGEDADEIRIKGLYNNPDVNLRAYVNEYSLLIPAQESAGINFKGSGRANVAFDQLTLEFTADDGGGVDEVKTVCTR